MKIAIATYIETGRYPSSVPNEDEMLLNLFTSKNHKAALKVWDDDSVNWSEYDVIIIKSTWDYFVGKINKFYNWLSHIKSIKVPCLNHPDIIKWNADKHYLLDIEAKGLPIVPSYFIEKGELFDFDFAFQKFNSEEIVVKPCISGGAMNTLRLNKNNVQHHLSELNNWLKDQAFIVQPLKREILTEGEWSFVYFNGKFSHHLLKTGKEGEFRIQHFFGGSIASPKFNDELINAADKYIEHFAQNTLYARVDGVWSNNKFELMELELIEPYLFFFTNENSLNNYYLAFQELTRKL